MSQSKKRSGSNAKFPVRLHDMMAFAEEQGLESIIGWVLGGRGFIIHDADKLNKHILPYFFGKTKYKSFLRQLHMWDFERVSHGPNKGMYMHPYFVRGNIDLCGQMTRQMKKFFVEAEDSEENKISTAGESDADIGSIKSEFKKYDLPLRKEDTSALPGSRVVEQANSNKKATTLDRAGASFSSGAVARRKLEERGHQKQASTTDVLKASGTEGKKSLVGAPYASYPSASSSSLPMPSHEYVSSMDWEPRPIGTTTTSSGMVDDGLFDGSSSTNAKQYDYSDTSDRKSTSQYSPIASTPRTFGEDKKPSATTGDSNSLQDFDAK